MIKPAALPDRNPDPPATVGVELGFAAAEDVPIPYMQRLHEWKRAIGNMETYRWAHFGDVPFAPLTKPLSECTVALLTTAAPYQPDKGDQGPGAKYNAAAKFFDVYSGDTQKDHDLRVSHLGIDRKHTSMEDSCCWFPLPALRGAAEHGRIRGIAQRFHGIPTVRDPRTTLRVHAVEALRRCQEDGVDAAVLVANCTICHQTLCLVARALEAAGIATVVMACAKDIVEHVGIPRALFSDFPLGNAAGKPHDMDSQRETLRLALDVLESARAPRTVVQSHLRWSDSHAWKADFSNIALVSPQELERLRAEYAAQINTLSPSSVTK